MISFARYCVVFVVCSAAITVSASEQLEICDDHNPQIGKIKFECRWHNHAQSHRFAGARISETLISTTELKQLFESKEQSTVDEQIIRDVHFRPASYEEADSEEAESVPKEDSETESDPDTPDQESSSTSPINGTSRYALMSVEQLNETAQKLRQEISDDGQISDAVKSSRLQILTAAGDSLLKLNELLSKTRQLKQEIDQSEEEGQRLTADLDQVTEPEIPVIDEDTDSQSLISELKEKRKELDKRKQRLTEIDAKIRLHSDRVTQLPKDRSQANETLLAVREEIIELSKGADDVDNQLALILHEIRLRTTEAELKKLEEELKYQEKAARIDPIERDVVARDIKRLQTEVDRWETEIKSLQKNEVREEKIAASQAVETAHPSLKPVAERNQALVAERQAVVEKLQLLRSELESTSDQIESITSRRSEIKNKIDAAGLTGTNGMLLVDLRRNLQTTGESHIRIHRLQEELRELNLAKVSLNEARAALADPVESVQQMLGFYEPDNALVSRAVEFLEVQRSYLDQLIDDYQSYGRMVSEVSEARKDLIDEINKTVAYVDKNALWISSADPLSIADCRSAIDGLRAFFDPGPWRDMVVENQQRAFQHPYEIGVASLMLITLSVVNRRVKRKNQPTSESNESST